MWCTTCSRVFLLLFPAVPGIIPCPWNALSLHTEIRDKASTWKHIFLSQKHSVRSSFCQKNLLDPQNQCPWPIIAFGVLRFFRVASLFQCTSPVERDWHSTELSYKRSGSTSAKHVGVEAAVRMLACVLWQKNPLYARQQLTLIFFNENISCNKWIISNLRFHGYYI